MSYMIYKQTYAEGQAYRYHLSDEAEHLRYVAERTGLLLPAPTRLVEFFDPDHNLVGRLQPPDAAPWQRRKRYEVFVGEKSEEPHAVIREQWRLVDILLLRLPRYDVQLGKYCYTAQGSRYGEHFYEILRPRGEGETNKEIGANEEIGEDEEENEPQEMKVGQIQRPTVGPDYIVETHAAPLRQAPLVLAALVILIDMELYSWERLLPR
jgi:hypothetical protein